jgi:hypothetical protein
MPEMVHHLDTEHGQRFFAKAFTVSDEAKAISMEMQKGGLRPQLERTHLFNVFSPDDLRSLVISITPFSSEDLSREGGLSISDGGHAQGVIVEMKGTDIVAFTHLAVSGGQLVSTRHATAELEGSRTGGLTDDHVKAFAERIGKVRAAKSLIEITPAQVRTLATVSYNALLSDNLAHAVHSTSEIVSLRGNSHIVAEIALFVLFRTQGSSCCSCSCSCWGSSSCSSSYIK